MTRLAWMALGLILICTVARAQSAPRLAEFVPANACLAIASGDLGATCQEFLQTRVGETLSGPSFDPLIEELRRRQMAGPLNLRPAFGFDWIDLQQTHSPGGLFIFPLANGRQGAAWIFAGSTSGESGPLVAAAKYFAGRGFTSETTTKGNAQLVVLRSPEPKRSAPVLLAAQGFYGVVNSLETADALLAVRPEKSLAGQPDWTQAATTGTTAAPRPGDVTVLLRPFDLWELMRKESDQQAPPQKPTTEQAADESPERDPLEASRQLGFDGVTSVAGRVTFPAEALNDWRLQVSLATPEKQEKALRLLAMPAGPMPELPAWVTAGLTSATFWRWDFPTAMKGFGNLFDEANEPGPDGVGLFEDMLDGLRDDPEGVQVDLRSEVFAHLGPDITSITDRQGPQTKEQPHGDRALYVTRVRDMIAVTDALKRFYHDDDRVTHARVSSYDLWTVPEGASLFVEGESDSVVSIRALAVGEERVLFGTDENLLRTILTSPAEGSPFGDDTVWTGLWQNMKQRQPDAAALWGLARLDVTLQPAYAEATSETSSSAGKDQKQTDPKKRQDGSLMAGLWRILLFGTADREAQVPTAAAPTFDQVRAALQPASLLMSPTDAGWAVTIEAARGDVAK